MRLKSLAAIKSTSATSSRYCKICEIRNPKIVPNSGRPKRHIPRRTYLPLPLFLEAETGESIEEALDRTGFDEAWNVLQAMQEQDAELAEIIREMREDRGRAGGFDDSRLRERVEVLGPEVSLEALRQSIAIPAVTRHSAPKVG